MAASAVIRHLVTGVAPAAQYADAALDQRGTPSAPIEVELPFVPGIPWSEGLEDPTNPTGLATTADPALPVPDVGARQIVGAYEGAVRTRGPVTQWSHEASGGLFGDQETGRTMRFAGFEVDRYDADGVIDRSWADELAADIANNGQGQVSEAVMMTSLLMGPNYQ